MSAKKPKPPKDPHLPKRPQSSYFLFMNERRPLLRKENPNNSMIEISKLISVEWKSLPNKSHYIERAAELKGKYENELSKYKKSSNFKKFQKKLKQWQNDIGDTSNSSKIKTINNENIDINANANKSGKYHKPTKEKEKMFDPVMEKYTISGRHNNIITKTGAVGWNLAFGKQVIPSNNNCVYQWKVKRVTGNQKFDIILGFDGGAQHLYQYYSSGALSINGKSVPEGKGKCSNITFKKRGDIMTFILNFATSTITICKNDGDGNGEMTDIIFENIKKGPNIKYKFVVMMYRASESLHFLEIPDVNEVNNEVNNDGKKQNDKQQEHTNTNNQVHAAEVKAEKHKKKHKHSKKSKGKNDSKSKTKINNEVNDENVATNTNNQENGNGFDRPLDEYKVNELKKFLKERSLQTSGLKKELVARLIEAVKKENDSMEEENRNDKKKKKKKKDKKNKLNLSFKEFLKREKNIGTKRALNETNEEIVVNAPKIKKQRRNHNCNDDVKHDEDIRRMTVEEAKKLKKGDLIDHQYRDGKYMAAKVINIVRGSDLRMEYVYNKDTIWCDYTEQHQLKRFAKYKSISSRPPHLLSHLQLGDGVYLNLKNAFEHKAEYAKLGWIKCAIKEKDNGQIKAQFVWQNKEISHWVHLDESDIVSDNEQWVKNQTTRYIPESIKRQLAYDQNNECKCGCGERLLPTYEIDHIRPVHKGGTNDRKNLQALNPQCHRNKTNSDKGNGQQQDDDDVKEHKSDNDDVASFLSSLDLDQYSDIFKEKGFYKLQKLHKLTNVDLRDFGVNNKDRKKVLNGIKGIEIYKFLSDLRITDCFEAINSEGGYKELSELKQITNDDLKELDVKQSARKILLQKLK